MGTSKKLVLAALVSMMMVFAFMLGFVPSHDAEPSSAANTGEGRVDMAGLLDMILAGDEGGKGVNISAVTLSSRIEGLIVKTPARTAQELQTLKPEIPVPVEASISGGSGTESVTFVANVNDDQLAWANPPFGWAGNTFSDPVFSPYASALSLGEFVTGVANTQRTVLIYALVNAVQGSGAATLTYQDRNRPLGPLRTGGDGFIPAEAAVPLTIIEVVRAQDSDENGFPDNPFDQVTGIGAGEVWIAVVNLNGVRRTVMIANLDSGTGKGAGSTFISPTGNVVVETPDLAALQAAGLIGAGEQGFAVVQVVEGLEGLIDGVTTEGVFDASPAAIAEWVAKVTNGIPADQTTGTQFVEVSILRTLNSGANFDEIDSLEGTGLAVEIILSGLNGDDRLTQLWSYPTSVDNVGGTLRVTNVESGARWSMVAADIGGGSLSATVQRLSVFGVFESGLVINSVSPTTIPQNVPTDLTITGIFPISAALSVYQATQAYTVYVGGQIAPFRAGIAKQDTAANGTTMTVTTPGLAGLGAQDVEILDRVSQNNVVAQDAVNVLATGVVTTAVQLEGGGSVAGASVALNPTSGSGLPAGTYFLGDSVTASVTFDTQLFNFVRWELNGVPEAAPATGLTFNVGAANAVVAILSEIPQGCTEGVFSLTTNVVGSGGITANPLPEGNGLYCPDTVVTLTATPIAGFQFDGWSGDVTSTANPVTVTMSANRSVTATFSLIPVPRTLTVTTDGNGTVEISPQAPGNIYTDGAVVTLTATPNTGFVFSAWTGPDAGAVQPNATSSTVTIVMSADRTLQATFEFAPLTVIDFDIGQGDGPAEVWIFGGVVAQVRGTGFSEGIRIRFGKAPNLVDAPTFNFSTSEGIDTVETIIPASNDVSSNAIVMADVVVGDDPNPVTFVDAVTYRRFDTSEAGVTRSAFIFDGAVGTTQALSVGEPHNVAESGASITIPALTEQSTTIFALVSNQVVDVSKEVKLNTPGLGTSGAQGAIGAGNAVDGILDFSVHFYDELTAKQNTPPVGSGVFASASGLLNIGRSLGANGNPIQDAAVRLTFPVAGVGLNAGDVRNGLTMWGVESELNYVTEITTIDDVNPLVEYQSSLLSDPTDGNPAEVTPAVLTATANSTPIEGVMEARLYSLNGFSLRRAAVIPSEVADGIRLDSPTGTASDNDPVQGPTGGGNQLRLVSPLGGLAYVDRIVFERSAGSKALPAVQNAFITPRGQNEFELVFNAPANTDPAITDIVIFLRANPNVEAARLERVYEYVRESIPLDNLILLLLGLLVALIALSAGDSGGGGGGPCFIATAAYGTPMAAEIDTLRMVRDEYLLTNPLGAAFVDTYYKVSPAVADVIAGSPVLAAIVRVLLVPVLFAGKIALALPALTGFMLMTLALFFAVRRRARKDNS